MRYFIIDGKIDTDCVNRFVDFLKVSELDHVTIYLDSDGGWVASAQILADIINKSPESFTVVANNTIRSAAFWLFFFVECKTDILDGTTGIYHLGGNELRVTSNGKPDSPLSRFVLSNLEQGYSAELEFCIKIGMSGDEVLSVSNGDEAFFTHKRLIELKRSKK